jgi:ADP-ribose pyrophosphatase
VNTTKNNPTPGFDDVDLKAKTLVFDGFFKINKYKVQHQLFSGEMGGNVERELFERGDAAVVLPYDPVTDEVVLIEQFRIGAYSSALRLGEQQKEQHNSLEHNSLEKDSPWLIECIAGMIDKGQSAEQVAVREAVEEADIELTDLKFVMKFFPSPGGMSELMHLFVAKVDSTTAKGIHGLPGENEDIRVLRVKREEAFEWLEKGLITNGPTVIALQWLQLNFEKWTGS